MSYPMADDLATHERMKRNGRHEAASRPLIRASDIRDLAGPVERLIVEYPAAALATAFLTGVVVAWLVKRK
jgi:hypothetical protein